MNSDETFPVAKAVPRIDSFEILEPDGPPLIDEEQTWPVIALRPRSDSFEVIEPASAPGQLEVVIRVRCSASATPDEVRAFAERLQSAVESVRSPIGSFPVQISLPTQSS